MSQFFQQLYQDFCRAQDDRQNIVYQEWLRNEHALKRDEIKRRERKESEAIIQRRRDYFDHLRIRSIDLCNAATMFPIASTIYRVGEAKYTTAHCLNLCKDMVFNGESDEPFLHLYGLAHDTNLSAQLECAIGIDYYFRAFHPSWVQQFKANRINRNTASTASKWIMGFAAVFACLADRIGQSDLLACASLISDDVYADALLPNSVESQLVSAFVSENYQTQTALKGMQSIYHRARNQKMGTGSSVPNDADCVQRVAGGQDFALHPDFYDLFYSHPNARDLNEHFESMLTSTRNVIIDPSSINSEDLTIGYVVLRDKYPVLFYTFTTLALLESMNKDAFYELFAGYFRYVQDTFDFDVSPIDKFTVHRTPCISWVQHFINIDEFYVDTHGIENHAAARKLLKHSGVRFDDAGSAMVDDIPNGILDSQLPQLKSVFMAESEHVSFDGALGSHYRRIRDRYKNDDVELPLFDLNSQNSQSTGASQLTAFLEELDSGADS